MRGKGFPHLASPGGSTRGLRRVSEVGHPEQRIKRSRGLLSGSIPPLTQVGVVCERCGSCRRRPASFPHVPCGGAVRAMARRPELLSHTVSGCVTGAWSGIDCCYGRCSLLVGRGGEVEGCACDIPLRISRRLRAGRDPSARRLRREPARLYKPSPHGGGTAALRWFFCKRLCRFFLSL